MKEHDDCINGGQDVLRRKNKANRTKTITIIMFSIFVVLLIILLLFVFVCSPAIIYGESMQPTLHEGQVIMLSKVNKSPRVGDIVAYKKPTDDTEKPEKSKKVIKRVIGVAGDKFYCEGSLSYGGVAFMVKLGDNKRFELSLEQYKNLFRNYGDIFGGSNTSFTFKVPKDTFFTIGDNSSNSIDSRDYGAVPIKNIIGIKI